MQIDASRWAATMGAIGKSLPSPRHNAASSLLPTGPLNSRMLHPLIGRAPAQPHVRGKVRDQSAAALSPQERLAKASVETTIGSASKRRLSSSAMHRQAWRTGSISASESATAFGSS